MMNSRDYFVSAVIIALVVPLVIGGIYFVDVCEQRGKNTYIAKLDGMRDLILIGETEVKNFNPVNLINDDYNKANYIEFEVKYADGEDEFTRYDVNIEKIDFSPNVEPEDISWKLLQYDSTIKDYKVIETGNFLSGSAKLKLTDSIDIGLNDRQKYRLYYYVASRDNNYNRGKIYANVTIE